MTHQFASPERALLAAIIHQAVVDVIEVWKPPFIKKQHTNEPDAAFAKRKKSTTGRHLRRWKQRRESARAYLFGAAKISSFNNVCHMLDLDPDVVRERVRKQLLNPPPLGDQ